MSACNDLPRLTEDHFEPAARKISDLKSGEQAVLNRLMDLVADEEGHLWVNTASSCMPGRPIPGLFLLAERTETGFILWLDKEVKFKRASFQKDKYLPVVKFREAPEES